MSSIKPEEIDHRSWVPSRYKIRGNASLVGNYT